MTPLLKIYIGWDPREDDAYRVCRASLLSQTSIPIELHALNQTELRKTGLYWRPVDPLASTEFSLTRFLVPTLARHGGYHGWALFCDCDFLFRADIAELMALADPRYAVMCVQHAHVPAESEKMDGAPQTAYPRKNWSSLLLFNCGHPLNALLSPDVANSATPSFLHRLQWVGDDYIGALPETWNWLVGVSPTTGAEGSIETAKALHYTLGGPWFSARRYSEGGEYWREAWKRLRG